MLTSFTPSPTHVRPTSPSPSISSSASVGSASSSSSRAGSQSPAPAREPAATRIIPKEELIELIRAVRDSGYAKMMSLLAGIDSAVAEKVVESWAAIRAKKDKEFESYWKAVPGGSQGDGETREPPARLVTEEEVKRMIMLMEDQMDAQVDRLRNAGKV